VKLTKFIILIFMKLRSGLEKLDSDISDDAALNQETGDTQRSRHPEKSLYRTNGVRSP
jgi:hypothetical protein